MLGQLGKASLQIIQSEYDITRAAARREVGGLVDAGYVEVIRDGRGQAYRLS
jgi:DNA-binding transcriptional ArsR family regulator